MIQFISPCIWLKNHLYQASKSNNYLKSLLESLVSDAKEEKKEQLSDALKEIHKEAAEKVDNTFSYNLKMYDKQNNEPTGTTTL